MAVRPAKCCDSRSRLESDPDPNTPQGAAALFEPLAFATLPLRVRQDTRVDGQSGHHAMGTSAQVQRSTGWVAGDPQSMLGRNVVNSGSNAGRVRGGAGRAPRARWKERLADDSSGSYAAHKHVAMSLHETKSDNVTAQEVARG